MEFINIFSISWMVTCILISIPLFKIIRNNIHNKPVVATTILDLAYSDCIFFLFWYCLIFVLGVSACLLSETTSLTFTSSLIFSVASYFLLCNSLWSLTITGILRFVSILKKSEQAGIQSLGYDFVAIWKIRLISISLTSCLILSGHFIFNTLPAFFYTLHYEETTVVSHKPTAANKIYWIPIILVTLANAVPKIYTTLLASRLLLGNPEKYALSLETSLSFPFLISVAFAFQFTSRMNRLLYYDPLLVMFGCNIIPLLVVGQNKDMRQKIREHSLKMFLSLNNFFNKHTTVAVTPANFHNDNVDNEINI